MLVLKLLADQIRTGRDVAATEVRDTWRPSTRIPATLPDGRVLGTVTLTDGKTGARVTDEAAFTAWVRKHRPDEIVETVRPSYQKAVLAEAKDAGAPVTRDGELIPGVEIVHGDPYPSVRAVDGAMDAVRDAWSTGQLDWSIVPEIGP